MLISMTLAPFESRLYALSGAYLLARRIEGNILISDPNSGLPETEIRQADIVELKNQRQLTVKNNSATQAVIELQSSTVPIRLNDGGSVVIAGGSIDSIRDSITVSASATVENGTVTDLSCNSLSQSSDVTIEAGATVTVLAASPTDKKRIALIQNISAAQTVLRVGAAPSATAGAVLIGSIDGVATLEINSIAEIKIHNASATPAKVAVMWGKS